MNRTLWIEKIQTLLEGLEWSALQTCRHLKANYGMPSLYLLKEEQLQKFHAHLESFCEETHTN